MAIYSSGILDFKTDILPLTGNLRIPLTHDYMFNAVFRHNLYALKGLLAARLGLDPKEITDLRILDPMEQGAGADDKDIILDIKACLNSDTFMDIEMQVTHYNYLPDRFLYQLCRVFAGSLPKGMDYDQLPSVIHIAILDCDLFPKGDPRNTNDFIREFYVQDVKNHQIYTGKFRLDVVSLKYLENADDKKEPNSLYRWARLLKAATWEEIKMIAADNTYMESVAVNVCAFCHDPKFVAECERRLRNELEYHSRMAEADREGMKRGMERGMKQGMKQGLEQGLEQGIKQGISLHLIDQVCKKLEKGKTPEDTASELETDIEEILPVYTAASRFAPDYDRGAILASLQKMSPEQE